MFWVILLFIKQNQTFILESEIIILSSCACKKPNSRLGRENTRKYANLVWRNG